MRLTGVGMAKGERSLSRDEEGPITLAVATKVDGLARDSRSEAPFAPGELIGGRYRIVRFISRGGFGEVYEADDCLLAEPVALKILLGEVASNPNALARFKREVQLARKVTHPNVCRVFDV